MKSIKPRASDLIGRQISMWNMSNDFLINSGRLQNIQDPVQYLFKMMKSKFKTEYGVFDIKKIDLIKLIDECHNRNIRIDIACIRKPEVIEEILKEKNYDFNIYNGRNASKLTNAELSEKNLGLWTYDHDSGAMKDYKLVINSGTWETAVLSIECNLV